MSSKGLSTWNPIWDQTRAQSGKNYVYEDEDVLIATDFECANGENFRPDGEGYAIDLEPEPGDHRYGGRANYYCFAIKNKHPEPRAVSVSLRGNMEGAFTGQAHAVLRRGNTWFHLDPKAVHPHPDTEVLQLDLPLPGANEPDPVLFVSDFHWHPYTELKPYLDTLADHPDIRISTLAHSTEGRPIYSVEIGSQAPDAPHIVMSQTPQPSEMGTWASRAVIDDLISDDDEIARIRAQHRFTIVPATNPDGTVRGLGVSHHTGRFPYFEGALTAEEGPDVLPEMAAIWNLLKTAKPWLFIEWHSNNWDRRPGQMLLRFRPHLASDATIQTLWEAFDDRLMALPETYHGNWTAHDEGLYQNSLCFQSITRLGAISHMIKHHDKFPLKQNCQHAVMCIREAVRMWETHMHV